MPLLRIVTVQHGCQQKPADVNKIKDTGNSELAQSVLGEQWERPGNDCLKEKD